MPRGDLQPLGERAVQWIGRRRGLAWWLSGFILLLAAADAWSSRHQINSDGISYLDLGQTVVDHGVKAGASVAWSPVYTWVLGGVLKVLAPRPDHELALVMAVNVVIAALVLAAFAWWLRELSGLLTREDGAEPFIPGPIQMLVAWAVVAWVVSPEITATLVTPDLLLAAVAFAAAAALVRVGRRGGSPLLWLLLGALLGFGYLVKSAFILPALVGCLVCGVLSAGRLPRRVGAVAVTALACLCVAGPFIGVLSSKEGKLEVGGYGTLNYAWDVDNVTPYLNWTGGDGTFGRPVHPTLIAGSPQTFAYGSPVGGSIPVWYDPTYWYQGVQPRFRLGSQVKAVIRGIGVILKAVVEGPIILLLLLLGLILWVDAAGSPAGAADSIDPPPRRRDAVLTAVRRHSFLALPLAGLITYLPLHEDPRFMAEYMAMLAVTAWLLVARIPRRTFAGRGPLAPSMLSLAAVVVAVLGVLFSAVKPLDHVAKQAAGHAAPGGDNELVADALRRAGIGAGGRVAYIGQPVEVLSAYWARLDRARVVGNIDDVDAAFWHLPPGAQSARLSLLRSRSGADAVVTDEPQARSAAGWVAIAGTGDSYLVLRAG